MRKTFAIPSLTVGTREVSDGRACIITTLFAKQIVDYVQTCLSVQSCVLVPLGITTVFWVVRKRRQVRLHRVLDNWETCVKFSKKCLVG